MTAQPAGEEDNMLLFIDACVRSESRTRRLAEYYLSRIDDGVTEVRLADMDFPKADEAFLRMRDESIRRGDFSSPLFQLAREFAAADEILIAAPYWDLSFPAVLKQYFEQINVLGMTFLYSSEGIPQGLCRAGKLTYITTVGGPIYSEAYGFGYIQALAEGFYHIPEVRLIKAEGLDIQGADVEGILRGTEAAIDRLFS